MPRIRHHRGGRTIDPLTMALLQRPQSTMAKIVFPWCRISNSFLKSDFNPIATQGRVSDSDIEQVFSALKTCPNYQIKPPYWLLCLIPLIMFGGMGLMLGLLLGVRSSSGRPNFLAFIVFPFMFILLIIVMCCFQKQI